MQGYIYVYIYIFTTYNSLFKLLFYKFIIILNIFLLKLNYSFILVKDVLKFTIILSKYPTYFFQYLKPFHTEKLRDVITLLCNHKLIYLLWSKKEKLLKNLLYFTLFKLYLFYEL